MSIYEAISRGIGSVFGRDQTTTASFDVSPKTSSLYTDRNAAAKDIPEGKKALEHIAEELHANSTVPGTPWAVAGKETAFDGKQVKVNFEKDKNGIIQLHTYDRGGNPFYCCNIIISVGANKLDAHGNEIPLRDKEGEFVKDKNGNQLFEQEFKYFKQTIFSNFAKDVGDAKDEQETQAKFLLGVKIFRQSEIVAPARKLATGTNLSDIESRVTAVVKYKLKSASMMGWLLGGGDMTTKSAQTTNKDNYTVDQRKAFGKREKKDYLLIKGEALWKNDPGFNTSKRLKSATVLQKTYLQAKRIGAVQPLPAAPTPPAAGPAAGTPAAPGAGAPPAPGAGAPPAPGAGTPAAGIGERSVGSTAPIIKSNEEATKTIGDATTGESEKAAAASDKDLSQLQAPEEGSLIRKRRRRAGSKKPSHIPEEVTVNLNSGATSSSSKASSVKPTNADISRYRLERLVKTIQDRLKGFSENDTLDKEGCNVKLKNLAICKEKIADYMKNYSILEKQNKNLISDERFISEKKKASDLAEVIKAEIEKAEQRQKELAGEEEKVDSPETKD